MSKMRTTIPALLAATTLAAVAAPSASAAQIGQYCQANHSFTYNAMYVPQWHWVRIKAYAGSSYRVTYVNPYGQVFDGYAVRSYLGACKW